MRTERSACSPTSGEAERTTNVIMESQGGRNGAVLLTIVDGGQEKCGGTATVKRKFITLHHYFFVNNLTSEKQVSNESITSLVRLFFCPRCPSLSKVNK